MKRSASLEQVCELPRGFGDRVRREDIHQHYAATRCRMLLGAVGWLCLAVLGCGTTDGSNSLTDGDTVKSSTGGRGAGGSSSSSAKPVSTGGSPRSTTSQEISIAPTTATTSTDPNATCGSVQVDAEVKTVETVVETPGNVLFVFDQSDSMNDLWEKAPKWKAANDAIVAAFTPLQDKLNAGAVLFPMAVKSGCDPTVDLLGCILTLPNLCPDVASINSPPQIPIQSGRTFLAAWQAYWTQGASLLELGTPTEKGLLQAETALGTTRQGETALVLVTDGMPTCGSNESAITARLLQKNIKTYVVGLPGGSGIKLLDDVALAGGTAPRGCTSGCYLTPVDVTEFQQSLASIATTTVTTSTEISIVDCIFQLTPPADANASATDVHLIVTQMDGGQQFEVPQAADSWRLSDDATTATLEGVVCEAAKDGVFSNLSFQYGCVTVPEWPTLL
jgi:hypothetical protein